MGAGITKEDDAPDRGDQGKGLHSVGSGISGGLAGHELEAVAKAADGAGRVGDQAAVVVDDPLLDGRLGRSQDWVVPAPRISQPDSFSRGSCLWGRL